MCVLLTVLHVEVGSDLGDVSLDNEAPRTRKKPHRFDRVEHRPRIPSEQVMRVCKTIHSLFFVVSRVQNQAEEPPPPDVICALGDATNLSRSDIWQTKFSQICQDIRDIKPNSISNKINTRKLTITSTQTGSTNLLDNHKLLDCDTNEGDDQDESCYPYKPSLGMTKGRNTDN
jgi:hypothetical protein